jgi:class 3 adenylate cyclase/tetratricopeptide (TPR) repeat protein
MRFIMMAPMACPRCGSDVPGVARFCPACGADLATSPGQEERKLVSILFVDLVGSTERGDGADPEDLRDRNQMYFESARERIAQYGGVVEKYIGDAVMAVFGAPLARLDDAERAVRAGLAVLDGIQELNAAHPGLDLAARAGVCTGEAVVTLDPAPGEPLATGDVLNTASRLQSAAPPGRVIIGLETYRLIRHAFGFEELAPIDAKGKREPVAAWLVGAPSAAPGSRPISATPLVGRDRELLLTRTVWQGATGRNRPHLVSVLGPPGVGKTRLAREFSSEIEAAGGRALWGRSLPYEERTPYRALGEMIRHTAGIYENDAVGIARTKLADAVGSLFPAEEAVEATRFLSLLLGLGLDAPADESIHLFFAARRFVELLARHDPLLLVFEDLHWADEALLEAIDYLVSHVKDAPVVFMALARPEFLETRPTWGAGMVGSTTMPLEPLTPDEAKTVVSSLLLNIGSRTVDRIVATAEGNPLFLEELVASLGDEISSEELPTTVRAAISARIDALPASARAALLNASVIGQTFWRGVLSSAGQIEDIDPALEALEERGLIIRRPQSQVLGDVEFGFKHVLIRDVAYGTLPRAARRELHAATARTVEESATDTGGLAWLLAHHWREAGEVALAIKYVLSAAERARDASAVEETYELFTQAFGLATTDEDRRRIRLQRGLALVQLEEYDRARPELEELLPDLDGHDEVEGLLALAEATFWRERTEQTLQLAERAVTLIGTSGPAELEPLAIARLGQAFGMRGEEGDLDRAIELGDRALAHWSPNVRNRALAEHYHLHADTYYWTGGYERALDLSRSAAATGGLEPNSAEFVLRGAGMEGLILAGMGRYEEALAAGEVAISTARRMGRRDNVVMNYSTTPLRDIFSLGEARERSATVVDRLGPSDFNMPWMNARADLIGADLLLREYGSVEKDWPEAWDDAVASKAWERWLISGRLAADRAALDLALGRLDDAVTWARRAIEMARSVSRRKYLAIALTILGRALTAQGLAHEAVAELRSAVAEADALGSPLFRWQARLALAAAVREAGDATPDELLADARSIILGVAASLSSERKALYLAAPQVVEALEATK